MIKDDANNNIHELINRVLSGNASLEEIERFENWLSESLENKKLYQKYLDLWDKSVVFDKKKIIDIDAEWDVFNKKLGQKNNFQKNRFSIVMLYKIAASILIGLFLTISIVFIYGKLSYETLSSKNETLNIELPDGSRVELNKLSKLSYRKNFDKERKLKLDGEAFFNVVKNENNPFVVKTGKVKVQVLGTSFNVRAYKNEKQVKVIVETGKVMVFSNESPEAREVITKGEKILYSREKMSGLISENEDANYKSWKTGVLNFDNYTLNKVLLKLEELYNVKFRLADSKLGKCRISADFENENLDYILEIISLTLELKIEYKNGIYLVSGNGC